MFYYYKVTYKDGRDGIKEIGVFSSKEKALKAIDAVKDKHGFADDRDGFSLEKFFKLFKPLLLDEVFWFDGIDTYVFNRRSNIICCDEEQRLMRHFSFLLTEYGFKFDKLELGDMVDENGKRWCYGPYNCYYFYNDKLCINFLNLVQKGDWYVYVTEEVFSDQNLISKGKKIPGKLCYDWSLFGSVIKEELAKEHPFGELDRMDIGHL